MGAEELVANRREQEDEESEEEEGGRARMDPEVGENVERGGRRAAGILDKDEAVGNQNSVNEEEQVGYHISMLHQLNPSNPLRLVVSSSARVPTPSSSQSSLPRSAPHHPAVANLNSRRYTDKIMLFIFVVHKIAAIGLVGFLVFKGIKGLIGASNNVKEFQMHVLKYFLPQVEAASVLSITLAFTWQGAIRTWPVFMVHFIIWSSFLLSLSAGILLICFQTRSTDILGVFILAFSIGNGLYACWVNPRTSFCTKVLLKSLEPVPKFHDLNYPTYYMLAAGFVWISFWIFAFIGALNFYAPPLIILLLVLSLAWTTEVMRNVVNQTVSRVIALHYLRGMQSSAKFSFQRALSRNLGSACLGSLLVPAIEALRIVARGLNLLEGEDEFMFSCAHCCLNVMESIFRYGNGWAFVQIAAYGKSFVSASQDTWQLFVRQKLDSLVDADIISSVCFLTGVCSGSICLIVVASWAHKVHPSFIASLSLVAAFIGYLMTRIAMAVPHACVSCYYVCYAENPENRLFDKTIKDRLQLMDSNQKDAFVRTPRVPRRFMT